MIKLNTQKLPIDSDFLLKKYSDKINSSVESLKQKIDKSEIGFSELEQEYKNLDFKSYIDDKKKRFKTLVVLGIGGSALGTTAVLNAIKGKFSCDEYRVLVLDNVDPQSINNLINSIDLETSLFCFISKSGTTIEPLSQYLFFRDLLIKNELDDLENRVFFIVGENSRILDKIRSYKTFFIPENIGGRFSVLSVVGLIPLYFAGINIDEIFNGFKNIKKDIFNLDLDKNISLKLALIQHYLNTEESKNITVFFPYSDSLSSFCEWYMQLAGESLGKDGLGYTTTKSIGLTDQHSQLQIYSDGPDDKFYVFFEIEKFVNDKTIPGLGDLSFGNLLNYSKYGTQNALFENNRKLVTIEIDELNEYSIGEMILLFEMQVAYLGELYSINAFDQPGVERSKQITKKRVSDDCGDIDIINDLM